MKKHLTKIFAVMAMSVMTLTAWSSTVDDLVAIDHDWAFIADDVNANGTVGLTVNELYADGHILSAGWAGNSVATNKGSISFESGGTHLNSLRLKNTQNTLAFKVASPCTVTFYTYSDASRGIRIHKVKRESDEDASYYLQQPVSTPVWEASLDEAGVYYLSSFNGDFYFAGFEVVLEKDPAREFTFGYSAALEGTTLSSTLTKHEDGCATITTGDFVSTYDLLGGQIRDVYHGSETAYQIDQPFRNLVSGTTISTQDTEENGAENHGAYLGYSLTVDEGSKISLTEIYTDIYVANKSNWSYEYVIEDGDGNQLYKSPVQTIAAAKSGSDHTKTLHLFADGVQNLTGVVNVKLIWWVNSSSTYLAIKDFKVKGIKHEVESQTKTLNRIDVNGVEYDFINEGNTISTLLHAAPSVKFYYDVVNNWSDGSETAAADEDETIVASEDAGNYVAATTLASTPYSLTFTNIDLPKVFGIKRTVADETSTSSDEKVTAKRVSDDILVDPSVTGVTISKSYGLQSVMQDKSRAIKWFDGTAQQDCYIDKLDKNYRTQFEKGVVPESAEAAVSITSLDERCYYSFDLAVDLGYKFSLQALNSDVLKEMYGTHYQVKIYNNGELLKTLEDVGSATTEADMKRHFDLSEEAVLQELSGTVTVKMFVWNTEATKYVNIKDFTVEAVVEKKAGEGVEGLVFTDFTPAAHPVFTEGEVTATWSNISNNVGPQTENRGIRMQGAYEYKMKVEVPSDSYISEVVFVWNGKGNYYSGDEDPKRIIDLHILNSSDVEVDALEYRGSKVNETTWTCGDLRESELTFAQGIGGDIYVNSIRVTYLKKPASTTYTRTHAHMNLNTLCYPYQIDSYTGATFYTMLYKVVDGSGDALEVVLQEHVGALAAGKPYFYVPEGSELVCEYSGAYTAAGNDGNGVYGSYTDNAAVASGMYVTYNNQIVKAGTGVQLREYRAYINMDEVSGSASPVPGRRLLRIGNAANAPTGVENVQGDKVQSTKVLRNGQLYLMYNGTMYDVQGRMVK